MKKYKKLLLLASMLLFFASGYAQEAKHDPSLGLTFSIVEDVSTNNCMLHQGTKRYNIIHSCPYFQRFTYSVSGDIKVQSSGADYVDYVIVEAKNPQSFSKGRLSVIGYYSLPATLSCVSDCWLQNSSVFRYVDIYQKFTIDELDPKDREIAGPTCLRPDEKEYVYSVNPVVSQNMLLGIGIDEYEWKLPPSGNVQKEYHAEDLSAITLKLNPGQKIGKADTLKVWLGRCNFDSKPLIKILRPGSELPEVEHDSLNCIETDTVYFKVSDNSKLPGYDYWFMAPEQPNFKIIPITGDDHVKVFTDGFSGKLTLYASNKFDTASQDFHITRRTYLSCAIQGDSTCLEPNTVLKYNLYPSPNVDVTWTLPDGWRGDKSNPKSSTVYFILDSNAVSGMIKAESAECSIDFDSIFVSVAVNNYVKEGIISDNGKCFTKGDTVTFRFKKDPNSQFYEWTFPSADWKPTNENYTTENGTSYIVVNDTAMEVVVGEIGKIKLTSTSHCGNGEAWTMTLDSISTSPSIDSIKMMMMSKSCINDGVSDTIVLVAENAKGITHYQWSYPNTWNLLSSSDSMITLQTDNIGGSHNVSLVGINQQCPQPTDTMRIVIAPTGNVAGNITMEYYYVPPFDPIYYNGPTPLHYFWVTDPVDEATYDYSWYEDSDLVNPFYVTWLAEPPYADTSAHNYCVVLTNKSTGCSSRKWLKDVSSTTGYTDTIIEVTPPVVPPALTPRMLELPDDNSEDEETEQPTQQSVQKSAPKVTTFAKEPVAEPSFRFYPNPTKDNIHVQFDGKADYIEILNLLSVSQLKKRCTGEQMTINVSHLKRGFYLVKVTFGGKVVTEKLHIVE